MKTIFAVQLTVLALLSVVAAGDATAQLDSGSAQSHMQTRAQLEAVSREVVSSNFQDDRARPAMNAFQGDRLKRVGHGAWSLLIPGWSQLKSGHTNRAIAFASAEAAIWTSYIVFKVQGRKRQDSYQEFATLFAGVDAGDRNDDYWRALASFDNSEQYNNTVRRDERVGIEPDGPLYVGPDAWRWTSERRFREYRILRGDSIDAFDRATFVTLFALVNRVASFVDAVRSGPPGTENAANARLHGLGLDLQLDPDTFQPVTNVTLSRTF